MYHLHYDDLAVIIPDFASWVKQKLFLNWIRLADGTRARSSLNITKEPMPISEPILEIEFATNYKITEANYFNFRVIDLWTDNQHEMTRDVLITNMMARVRDESYFTRQLIMKYY